MAEDVAERVLDAIRLIPRGRVMSYGDVAEYVGIRSARQVGAVLRDSDEDVPWWRVVNAVGRPKPYGGDEQLARLRKDRVPLVADGSRVDMKRARWDGQSQ